MSCFWLVIGAGYLLFWPDITSNPRAAGTMRDRMPIAVFCFALFSYNFFRWRMGRLHERARREAEQLPPRPRRAGEKIDPTFDFSDPKPGEEGQQKPPSS